MITDADPIGNGAKLPGTMEIFDNEHAEFEDRFIAIGPIRRGLVVVVYTEREEDITRIIGARLANKNEQSLYHSHMDQYR